MLLLREVAAGVLFREVIDDFRKMGFLWPSTAWLREQLGNRFPERVLDGRRPRAWWVARPGRGGGAKAQASLWRTMRHAHRLWLTPVFEIWARAWLQKA